MNTQPDRAAGALPDRPARTPSPRERLAYAFYSVAATGAVIGQTWVALTHIPWNPHIPALARVAAVLPFGVCLELLAVAVEAMADERMRAGERAYGMRAFSATVAAMAVAILVAGHWPHLYWSIGFGLLSTSAYLLWRLHAAARRRDALRAAGKLADTAPDYGLWRRLRHPIWTARAAELARAGHTDPATGQWTSLGLYESLHAAHQAIRADKRRPAIAAAVEQVVRADQRDPRMADIAVHTLDLDRLAAELADRVDYQVWADRLAAAITATAPNPDPGTPSGDRRNIPPPAAVSPPSAQPSGNEPAREPVTPALPAGGSDTAADTSPDAERFRLRRQGQTATQGRQAGPTNPAVGSGLTTWTDRLGETQVSRDTQTGPPLPSHIKGAQPSDSQQSTTTPQPSAEPPDTAVEATDISKAATVDGGESNAGAREVPSETSAAVAYWYQQDPSLHPAKIAARIGRSERTVRRHWPPMNQRPTNGS